MRPRSRSTALLLASLGLLVAPQGAHADILHSDDVIINFGSLCVGQDCVNGENFGFDTLRLKENNLRIHINDTSASGGFPSNDWRLTFNDSSNGGDNYFSLDDATSNRAIFRIDAGAPANSLRIDNGGDVGIGEHTPVVELHVSDGDSPTLRLEQDGSSGFAQQTWDVAGNEANFFVRDVTNSSRLIFRIKPGAPANSLFIAADGDVGMGTETPSARLHVRRDTAGTGLKVETVQGSAGASVGVEVVNNGAITNSFQDSGNSATWTETFEQGAAGSFELTHSSASSTPAFELTPGGDVILAGNLTSGSSRSIKTGIEVVEPAAVLEAVNKLTIHKWRYKRPGASALHLSPMAEDFHAAFGLGVDDKHVSALDTAGVALASIQALHAELQERNRQLADENSSLQERLAALEAQVQELLEAR